MVLPLTMSWMVLPPTENDPEEASWVRVMSTLILWPELGTVPTIRTLLRASMAAFESAAI